MIDQNQQTVLNQQIVPRIQSSEIQEGSETGSLSEEESSVTAVNGNEKDAESVKIDSSIEIEFEKSAMKGKTTQVKMKAQNHRRQDQLS